MQSIQRLRTIKTSVWRSVGMPELRKRAANSWSAVQDTYYSTKACLLYYFDFPKFICFDGFIRCAQCAIGHLLCIGRVFHLSLLMLKVGIFLLILICFAVLSVCLFPDQDTFERHRVVFTIGTSIASAATALIG